MLNPIQDGHFWGCSQMREGQKRLPLPKICHTYLTMMKLDIVIPNLKKIQKVYESRDTPRADISIFSPEISKFCYIKQYRYRLNFTTWFLIVLAFLESLQISLINLVIILMMSAKIATPVLLKITVFWNKGYDVIISVDDVTNKILSRDSNNIEVAFMWPKFGNCSISMKEVITTSIL